MWYIVLIANHKFSNSQISKAVTEALNNYKFDEALNFVWSKIKEADQYVSEKRVWELKDVEKQVALAKLIDDIRQIAVDLAPFIPDTAEKIRTHYESEKIEKITPLFPRLT